MKFKKITLNVEVLTDERGTVEGLAAAVLDIMRESVNEYSWDIVDFDTKALTPAEMLEALEKHGTHTAEDFDL